MHWSSCNDYAQSHKDLTTNITDHSKGDQLLGTILLALSFLNLTQSENSNFETFPDSILTITSEQELPPYRLCQYGPSRIITILPTVLEQPIFGKP